MVQMSCLMQKLSGQARQEPALHSLKPLQRTGSAAAARLGGSGVYAERCTLCLVVCVSRGLEAGISGLGEGRMGDKAAACAEYVECGRGAGRVGTARWDTLADG
jgi:hypothetical protein